MTVGAIAIKGRPDFEEKGGEFVKSFTIHYSSDKETWIPYKSHGKIKVSLDCGIFVLKYIIYIVDISISNITKHIEG